MHLVCITIAVIIVAFVSTLLSDGRSIVVLKEYGPIVTNTAIVSARLTDLLGHSYGIGLHHDSSGRSWSAVDPPGTGLTGGLMLNELIEALGAPAVLAALPSVIAHDSLKHPVQFLSCIELRNTGLSAMALAFIADALAAVLILLHAAVLGGLFKPKLAKIVLSLIWFVITIGIMIVVILACIIFTHQWDCDQPVIPTLRVGDHFDLNYGLPLAVIGFVAAGLALLAVVTMLSSAEEPSSAASRVDVNEVNPIEESKA